MTLSLIPDENDMKGLCLIAKQAMASGLYTGVGSEAKIFMILMAARELGIMPLQALNGGIWNINGKIEISARLMNSMIRRAGHSITTKVCNDKECVLLGKRKNNGDSFEASFTWDDAIKAGLASRAVWKQYSEDMLYARAMSRLARRLFSDVIGMAYVEGEIRDTKPEDLPFADAVDVTQNNVTPQVTQECVKIEQKATQECVKITQQHLDALIDGLSKTDAQYKEKFVDYISEKYGNANVDELPDAAFDACMVSINRKLAAVTNA